QLGPFGTAKGSDLDGHVWERHRNRGRRGRRRRIDGHFDPQPSSASITGRAAGRRPASRASVRLTGRVDSSTRHDGPARHSVEVVLPELFVGIGSRGRFLGFAHGNTPSILYVYPTEFAHQPHSSPTRVAAPLTATS